MLNVDQTAGQIEALTGYIFANKLLCAEAAQMASTEVAVVFNGRFLPVQNNKRLAILGDAVLQKVLCAAWFETTDLHGKGQAPVHWTSIRNEVLSNDALARRGYEIGVEICIFLARGTYRKTPNMVSTTLEAIIGAVFQDGGDAAVQKVIETFGFLNHRLLSKSISQL